jgi:Tfp pilus assembly protein PilO
MTLGTLSWRLKAGLVVAVLLILIRFVLTPLYERQDETIQRVKVLQQAIAKKKALIGNEEKIDVLLEETKSSLEGILKYYYQDFSDTQALQLTLQKKIEELASSQGFKIDRKDWLYASEGAIVQVPIKIICESEPRKIMGFLSAIENAERFFSVDRLKITSQGNSSAVRAEMDVSGYGVPDEKTYPLH